MTFLNCCKGNTYFCQATIIEAKDHTFYHFSKGKIALLYYDKYKEISSVGQKWALSPLLQRITHILEVGDPGKPIFTCSNIHVCTYYVELAFVCIIVYELAGF